MQAYGKPAMPTPTCTPSPDLHTLPRSLAGCGASAQGCPLSSSSLGCWGGPLWRDRLEQAERRWALQATLLEAFKPKDAGGQVLGAGLEGLRRAHGPGHGEGG